LSLALLIVVVVVLGAVGWYFFVRPSMGASSTSGPVPIGTGSSGSPNPQPTPAGGLSVENNLAALKPGDAVSFWDGTDCIVQGSLDCREMVNGRVSEWRWVFLSGDRVLELLPHGQAVYESGAIAHQGDEFYESVEALLRRFEANVREGIAHEPVLVNVDDADYKIRATGTFAATRVGQMPGDGEVWGDVSQNPDDNVYFKMVRADDSDAKDVALGVWTTHMAILRGRLIDKSEITGVFAK